MNIKLRLHEYSDAAFVQGVKNQDPVIQKCLYLHCKKYFSEHYRAVFFAPDDVRDDIFQNTYMALWENIERGKISVKDGVVTGKEEKPLTCSLMTYMMSIAELKYKEITRQNEREDRFADLEARNSRLFREPAEQNDWSPDDERAGKLEAISDCIAVMSERCRQILTLFYAENKKLDEMLSLLPTFTSKDALKTAKNKCMAKLRATSKGLYEERKKM